MTLWFIDSGRNPLQPPERNDMLSVTEHIVPYVMLGLLLWALLYFRHLARFVHLCSRSAQQVVQVICTKSRMDLAVECLMDPVTLMMALTGQGSVPYLQAPCAQWHIKRHFCVITPTHTTRTLVAHITPATVIKFVEDKILFYSSFSEGFCGFLCSLDTSTFVWMTKWPLVILRITKLKLLGQVLQFA